MKAHLLLLIVSLALLAPPLLAQGDDDSPSNAERARPSIDPDRIGKYTPPYIQSVPSISEQFGLFINSNMIVESSVNPPPQNESSIAISPVDSAFLIASAVDGRTGSYVYISTDGGRSWTNKSLGVANPDWQTGNDPSVGFDYEGNGYLMYGAFPNNRNDQRNGVYLAKTTDRGVTWQSHIRVIEHIATATKDTAFEDKYYIQIDNSSASPYRGFIYTPWKRVTNADSATQIVFTRSTDRGLTWSMPIPVSPRKPGTSLDTTFGQSFPLSTTGPDGSVYVVWNDGIIHSIGFAKSSDGGVTFTTPKYVVSGYEPLGTTKKVSGSWYHVLKGVFRAETYPTLMADNSNSTRRGWLYLAWAAGRSPKVWFQRSSDGGESWSQPKMIHSDTTGDKWWPWLSVDQTNGDIAVMYSDSRNDPANILIDQYVSYSSDGGDTWIDRRATDAMSDFRKNPFVGAIFAGDYSGNSFRAGKIYPSFLDTRDDNDVFTSLVSLRQPYPVKNLRVRSRYENLQEATLLWENPPLESIFGKPIADYSLLLRRDSTPVTTLPSTATSHVDLVPALDKNYTYDIRVVAGNDTSAPRSVIFRSGGARLPAEPRIGAVRDYMPQIEIDALIPGVRADSTTPLSNLRGYRLYRDSVLLREGPLAGDTGTSVTITDAPALRGYYRYALTLIDSGGNESLPSDTVIAYAGTTAPYRESFDAAAPKFLISDAWGMTSSLALSAPNSITDSPLGDYKARTNPSMQIFPVEMTTPVELKFAHIAIVDPGDSAIVEVSYDRGKSWTFVKNYSFNSDPAWSDKVAGAGDWRQELIVLKHPNQGAGAFGVVRFRLKTGSLTNADGWYIDDIDFGGVATSGVGVANRTLSGATAYPNPFSSAAIIEYRLSERSPVKVRIYDLMGRHIRTLFDGTAEAGEHSVTLDGSELPAGSYLYEVVTASGIYRGRLVLAK
jgi:hypothetical protein